MGIYRSLDSAFSASLLQAVSSSILTSSSVKFSKPFLELKHLIVLFGFHELDAAKNSRDSMLIAGKGDADNSGDQAVTTNQNGNLSCQRFV